MNGYLWVKFIFCYLSAVCGTMMYVMLFRGMTKNNRNADHSCEIKEKVGKIQALCPAIETDDFIWGLISPQNCWSQLTGISKGKLANNFLL